MFASRLTPEQWAEARRLRAEGTTLAVIGKHFGVNPTTIGHRARREGWPAPLKRAGAAASAGKWKPAGRSYASVDVRRRLTRRIYNIVDSKLELMELRMQKQLKQAKEAVKGDGDIPAGDEEQDTRHLATYIKTIDQATEFDPDRARDADGGADTTDIEARASEAEAFRREIAERLEKLIPPA
jgi:hypothetical protein